MHTPVTGTRDREIIMGVARRGTTTAPTADDYAPDTDAQDAEEGLTPEDENEETPRSSSVPRRGWGKAKETIKATSKFENEFKVTEKDQVAKFIEDEPFWSGAVHWVDEIKDGKRSFYCLDEVDPEGCPLCAVAHAPRAQVWFNVAVVTNEDGPTKPEVLVLKAGPLLSELIEKEHNGRYGPINRHYWKFSRSGGGKKGGKVNYSLSVVKATDLAGDWEVDPKVAGDAIAGLKPYTDSIVRYPDRETLEAVVEEYLLND